MFPSTNDLLISKKSLLMYFEDVGKLPSQVILNCFPSCRINCKIFRSGSRFITVNSFSTLFYMQVADDNPHGFTAALRKRLTADDPALTMNERLIIRQFLEACPDDE